MLKHSKEKIGGEHGEDCFAFGQNSLNYPYLLLINNLSIIKWLWIDTQICLGLIRPADLGMRQRKVNI